MAARNAVLAVAAVVARIAAAVAAAVAVAVVQRTVPIRSSGSSPPIWRGGWKTAEPWPGEAVGIRKPAAAAVAAFVAVGVAVHKTGVAGIDSVVAAGEEHRPGNSWSMPVAAAVADRIAAAGVAHIAAEVAVRKGWERVPGRRS